MSSQRFKFVNAVHDCLAPQLGALVTVVLSAVSKSAAILSICAKKICRAFVRPHPEQKPYSPRRSVRVPQSFASHVK